MISNMHSCFLFFGRTYIIRIFTYCNFSVQSCHLAESAPINPRVGFAPSRVQKEEKKKGTAERNHRILLNAVLLWHFNIKVHFTADKWTVQSIYAKLVLDFFVFWFWFFLKMIVFLFLQFQQVLLLVACLLTQLTFCVSALYMSSALYYCFVLFWGETGLGVSFWRLNVWIVLTNRFVYRAGDCVPNSEWTFLFFMEEKKRTNEKKKMERGKKKKNSWIILVVLF